MNSYTYQPPTSFSVFPPVIKNLLILNALFFFAMFVASAMGGPLAFLINLMGLYPIGAGEYGRTVLGGVGTIPGFMPWQLVTYAFLHGGMSHFFFNMLALWMFGVQIENAWGSRRFAIFYFVCVIGAALTQLVVTSLDPIPVPTVGASGGVYGVLLAFGMMFPDQPIYMYFLLPIKAKYLVVLYGVIELWAGMTSTASGIAHFAHLGGMVFGFFLIQYWRGAFPFGFRRERQH